MTWQGKLLLANPVMTDPNFARTAVLLVAHEPEEGALGVVLNRPLGSQIGTTFGLWGRLAAHPSVLFRGGPISPSSTIAVGLVSSTRQALNSYSEGGVVITERLRTVDLSGDPTVTDVNEIRMFAGYAGWAPGQLEVELESSAWFLVPALDSDVFCSEPERLWEKALRRQCGEIAMLAQFPDNASLN